MMKRLSQFFQLPSASTKLKPVMVFIHGGGFMAGSGSSVAQSPDFFMDYDVLCVTTNYRLHVFGKKNYWKHYF